MASDLVLQCLLRLIWTKEGHEMTFETLLHAFCRSQRRLQPFVPHQNWQLVDIEISPVYLYLYSFIAYEPIKLVTTKC